MVNMEKSRFRKTRNGRFRRISRWSEKDRGGAGKGEGAAGSNIRNKEPTPAGAGKCCTDKSSIVIKRMEIIMSKSSHRADVCVKSLRNQLKSPTNFEPLVFSGGPKGTQGNK